MRPRSGCGPPVGALLDCSSRDQLLTRQGCQFGDKCFYRRVALVKFAAEVSFAQGCYDCCAHAALVCLLPFVGSPLQLLHLAGPLSLGPFPFRSDSSELTLSSTASKGGAAPKIMPRMAL